MTKNLSLLFFFSLIICFSSTQNCVGTLSDDLIQAGTIDIINSNTNARQTLAQTQVLYTIPDSGFQVVFSFLDLQYNNTQGIDFMIRGGRIGNSNFLGISLLLIQDKRWDKIKISYLVNSRKDVWVGSFSYSPYSLNSAQNISGSLSAQVSGAVDGWAGDNSNLVFLKAVFLSGLQTGLKDFGLTLTNVTFDKVRGIIGVTLSNASKSVDLVTISYLIFVSPHARFVYDSFTYPGTIPVADYGFIGSSGFLSGGISGVKYYGINIESNLLNCQGSCSASCITKSNCTVVNGTSTGNDCFICPNNTKYNDTKKACVSIPITTPTCGANEQLVNATCQCIFGYIKLGQVCVSRCGVNQQWNGNGCVCSKGTANVTNVCRLCPAGSTPNANKTSCDCQVGSVFDENTLRCITYYTCQQNSTGVIEGGIYKCKCNADYYASGNLCIYCPAPALWNKTSLSCYCQNLTQNFNGKTCVTCGSGQYFSLSSKQCQCYSPRVLVLGECKCPNNLTWNNQTSKCECSGKFETLNATSNISCICASPYIRLQSKQCGLVCPQNQWWTAGQCKCKSPFVRINNKCTMNCSANQKWNGIECACVDNYFKINGICTTCTAGMLYNSTTKTCQNICGLNQLINGTQCVCKENYFRINSICSQCPVGTGYKASTGICVTCDLNQIQLNSLCICKANFYKINGSCGQCTAGTSYNQQKQTCDALCTKANEVYDGKNCVCAPNFYKINGICSQCQVGTSFNLNNSLCQSICKANQVFTSGSCVCVTNFYIVNGACSQCASGTIYNKTTQLCDNLCKLNQTFDGTNCVCLTNFYRISGVCGQCQAGTTYNKINQVCDSICKNNQIFNGTTCVCATNFYIINGVCGQCPVGTTYNKNTQICESSCKVNQTFDGNNCVCVTNLYRINGICGQCSAGTTYNKVTQACQLTCKANEIFDGIQCVCASGYIIINGVCDKCTSGTYYDDTLKKCVTQPVCPSGAEWNQAKLQCQCSISGQYLINGSCQACGTNAGWNGSKCVCRTGFYLIGGQCLTCDINSSYNSTSQTCICNRGFYGDRTLCQKCDSTCGKCSGSNSNQCIDCVDVSYTLVNGTCSKPASCVAGMYLSGSTCKACSAYCSQCKDENTCTQCTSGFSLTSVALTPTLTFYMCEQVCGDGKRFEYNCDDGNTKNGDGCNDQCEVESGWTCSGGSPSSKSTCLKIASLKTIISPKGAVQLSGKVMQGVTLSYLPSALTDAGCPNCSQVLLVSIIQAQVIPSFRVNFLPTTQYKYLIQFDFQGIFGIPPFTFTLRLNPDYAKYFSTDDMAQQITLTVDPAVLAIGEQVQDLTIQQILGEKIPIASGDLKKVFN